MAWGQIAAAVAPAVIGGILGNKAAKADRSAMSAANQMRMMPYTDSRSYVTDMYERGQGALDGVLDAGYYQGQTYAGLDPLQRQGVDYMGAAGNMAGSDATNFMGLGRGFASNYQDLFNRASQDMLGNAIGYASSNAEPLLAAAMRDPYRQLTEQTLPGIDRAAMSSGNSNSSRAGIAEAIANRAYDDRVADTATNIQNNLIDRSLRSQQSQLSNMTAANKNLAGLYNLGFGLAGDAGSMLNQAGGILSADAQARMNDDRARFEGNRDFDLNTLINYNAGILGRTPTSVSGVQANTANPMMGALSGAIAGLGFGQKFGLNPMDYFTSGSGGYSYGAGNPGSFERGTFSPTPNYNYGGL